MKLNKSFYLIFGLFLLCSSFVFAGLQQELYDKSMLIVHFDKNLTDDNSTYRNTGALLGSPTHLTSGCKVGAGCGQFNTNGVLFTAIPAYGLGAVNFSASCWVKYSSVASEPFLFSRTETSDEAWSIALTGPGPRGELWDPNDGFSGTLNPPNTWTLITLTYVASSKNAYLYINTTLNAQDVPSTATVTQRSTTNIQIGGRYNDPANLPYEGYLDECIFFNKTLSQTDIDFLWNSGAGISIQPELLADTFTIEASDHGTGASLNNFSVRIKNSTIDYYNSTTAGILTYTQIINGLYNITVWSNSSGGYYNVTYTDYNVSANLAVELTKSYYGKIVFSNYVEFDGRNYTRNLSYYVNYTCPVGSNARFYFDFSSVIYIDGWGYEDLNCSDGNIQQLFRSYVHESSTNYTAEFKIDTDFTPTSSYIPLGYFRFWSDLTPPVVAYLNSSVIGNFTQNDLNISLKCTDNYPINLTYNITFNDNLFLYKNFTNGTLVNNRSAIVNGYNLLYGSCSDFFSSASQLVNFSIYSSNIFLIDEIDNIVFDLNDTVSARVYVDDNSSYYDFKLNNRSSINFTSLYNSKLRFEFVYSDGAIITRYIDISLLSTVLRVCINKDGITHYPQYAISSTSRPVFIKNVFSQCYVGADYTRFAYQDSLSLKYFSIPSLYYLFVYDDNSNQVLLASLDGSTSSYNNLDTLEFASSAYDTGLNGDGLSAIPYLTNVTMIYYLNPKNDNTALNLLIKRMDLNEVVFNTSSFTNYNNFTVYFDYSTLTDVTNTTLFQIILSKTNSAGITELKYYFGIGGEEKTVTAPFAFTIALLLTLFGISLVSMRYAFSFFGIFILAGSLITLTFAPQTWYTNTLFAMDIVGIVYIILLTQISPKYQMT